MSKIKLTQSRSSLGRPKSDIKVLKALGLGRVNKSVEHEATPQILGMAKKLEHLVKIINL
ncbi:MAG: 50S ribosomal protein L30 [Cytophagales bacterium]|nr:50S ribosomal protein L30 [Cytophagales bacterium]